MIPIRDTIPARRFPLVNYGIIGVNTAMGADWDVPLGGYKQSGIGRENSREGLDLYLNTKSVFAQLKSAW